MADKVKDRQDKGMLVGSPLESVSLYQSPYFPESYYFPYNPDPLCRGNNYSVYDEMRDDDQVKVAISFKKDLVVNSGWSIDCDSDDIAQEVTDSLKEMEEFGKLDMAFEDILRGIQSSAYEFGFALSEPIYRLEGGKYFYDTVKVRPPHSFRFVIDDHGNILEIKQATNRGDLTLKPEMFIHYAYQSDFGNPYGKSDLRAAHAAWKAKKFISRFLNIYLEKFASPTVIAKYPKTSDSDEVNRLQTVLKTIQQNTFLAIPEHIMIEFVQATRDASKVYIDALNYYNMLIARAILVPDLMGISGDKTGGGSYSLGQEQFKLFMSTIEKDRQALSRKVTLRLIRPLVQANYGDVKCEFKFLPYSVENNTDLLKIWTQAVQGKVFKPNEDEINYLRSQLKFPEGPVEIPEPTPQLFPGKEPGEPGKELEEKPEEKPEGRPEVEKEAKEFKFRRDFTLHEMKVDFDKAQEDLRKTGESIARELTRILERMARELLQQAKEQRILDDFRPELITSLEPKFRRELNESLRGNFISLYRDAAAGAMKEMRVQEKKFVDYELIPEDFEKIIQAEAFKLTGDMSNEVRKRVANKMFDGVKRGLPIRDITDSIFSDLGKYTDAQLRTIVNTKTTEVFNSARMVFFNSDPVAQNLIIGYQYSAIMDETTTPVCAFLDQKVIDADKDMDFIESVQPALHYNCRSMWVPVTSFENPDFDRAPSIDKLVSLGANFLSRRNGSLTENTDA